MKSRSYLVIAAASVLVSSCKKDDLAPTSGPVESATISDFSQLTVGNYWVYEIVDLDSLGNDVLTWTLVDSMVVTGDSIIDGIPYMCVASFVGLNADGISPQRIDGDKLVSQYETLFQFGEFGSVIRTDTVAGLIYMDYIVDPMPVSLNVPAGTFSSYAMVGHVTSISEAMVPPHRFPTYHWAAGVGLVRFRTFSPLTSLGRELRLVRYHVQ